MSNHNAPFRRRLIALSSAVLLSACGAGAMQQSTMYDGEGEQAGEVDAPLAVGASIDPDVRTELRGSTAPALLLQSAQPEILATEQGRITGNAPGVAAVLVTTKDGTVIDFYHVWVERAERLVVQRLDAGRRSMGRVREGIDLLVGESIYLMPELHTGAQQLEGTVHARWEVDSPAVEILRPGHPSIRRVVARQGGEAKLTVRAADRESTVAIRVLDAAQDRSEPPPATAPEPAPDATEQAQGADS